MESTKSIGLFKRIIFSFTNFSLYTIVVNEKKRKALGYFLLLKLISIVIITYFTLMSFTNFETGFINMLNDKAFPNFSIHNGKAVIEVEKTPYVYNNTDFNLNLVVDDHNNYLSANYEANDILLIFDADGLYLMATDLPLFQVIEFAAFDGLEIDKLGLLDFYNNIHPIVVGYFTFVVIFTQFIQSLFGLFFYALIAYILGIIIGKSRSTYGIGFRIVCYTLTLNTLISTVLTSLNIANTYISIGLFFINVALIIQGIKAYISSLESINKTE